MVTIKGDSAFDANIVSHIENPQDKHIVFKNVTFGCETIEDAEGTVFVKRKTGHWIPIDDFPHDTWECDQCGTIVETNTGIDDYYFCRTCGSLNGGDPNADNHYYHRRFPDSESLL